MDGDMVLKLLAAIRRQGNIFGDFTFCTRFVQNTVLHAVRGPLMTWGKSYQDVVHFPFISIDMAGRL